MNSRGGELEAQFSIGDEFGLFAEFYQPIDFADRYYVFANAQISKLNNNLIAKDGSGEILSQARISGNGFQLGVGRNFGQWGSLRIGLQKTYSKIRGRIGVPSDTVIKADATTFTASFEVDTLDNVRFPHSGLVFGVDYNNSLALLGGDDRVDNVVASVYKPYTWGNNTLGLSLALGTSFNGTPDEIDLFPLGGFLNLTAFAPGQLMGNHGGAAGLIYYRRVGGGLGYLTQSPLYVGGLIETGNLWNDTSDISLGDLKWSTSVFLGADTFIGPVYLGGGIGSKGEKAAFLYVGQLF